MIVPQNTLCAASTLWLSPSQNQCLVTLPFNEFIDYIFSSSQFWHPEGIVSRESAVLSGMLSLSHPSKFIWFVLFLHWRKEGGVRPLSLCLDSKQCFVITIFPQFAQLYCHTPSQALRRAAPEVCKDHRRCSRADICIARGRREAHGCVRRHQAAWAEN